MRSQPNRDYQSNDVVMTPRWLAEAIADAVKPSGVILEPCSGDGVFVDVLSKYGTVKTCEASAGDDFFFWSQPVDWIVTNPPWSNFRQFLSHALPLATNVVFLATVNHWWTRRRVKDVHQAGFGYRRLILTPWPEEFPASGFQLGAMHLEKGWNGPMAITRIIREKAA